jgi:hypothetical protein
MGQGAFFRMLEAIRSPNDRLGVTKVAGLRVPDEEIS